MSLTEYDIALRLTIAALLGALVGFERERHNQPAGLRTHTILTIGSALAMCVSINLSIDFRESAPNGDPARLAAQVISGIGFLGAGAIIRFRASIKGLTTATSLWTVAIVGLAVGAGHFFSAGVATILLLGTLVILDRLEKLVIIGTSTRTITLSSVDHPNIVAEVKAILGELDIEAKGFSFEKNLETNMISMKVVAKMRDSTSLDRVIGKFTRIEGCRTVGVD